MLLYEILLPVKDNSGVSTVKARSDFADYCLNEVGGYSILPRVVGSWKNAEGKVFHDTMLPVRVACTAETWQDLVACALALFPDQECLFWYVVASDVHFESARHV